MGKSQSAFRLTTYADAVQPLVNVYDAATALDPPLPGWAVQRTPSARDTPRKPRRQGDGGAAGATPVLSRRPGSPLTHLRQRTATPAQAA
nr:alpha/beta hydrolase domain-containing protein [Kutzneria buriramensis]WKX16472.1 alpha/beta hydrolase domain-containing protein [Kutzneria buriramensis]